MKTRRRFIAALLLAVAVSGGACDAGEDTAPDPLTLDWQEIALPAPPAGERIVPRAAAVCNDHWYLAGAYAAADGATRPAAWTSTDGRTWSAMTLAPNSYYGRRSVIHTAACRDGRLAAVGGKPGGAHGNPRVSTWHLVSGPGGDVLAEVSARFELYGGPAAVNVGRLDAGPSGFLITGNRASGAAVWLSPDGARFDIVEGAPVLSSEPGRVQTWASDAVEHGGEWVVVGGTVDAGRIDRDPAVWTSADGASWRRPSVPGTAEYDELTLVVADGDALVAIGQHATTFRAWRLEGGEWRTAGRFDSTQPDAPPTGARGAPQASGLAAASGLIVAAVGDGVANRLWVSSDGGERWGELTAPAALPAGAERAVVVEGISGTAGGPGRLLLAVDDGTAGRIFLAGVPG